MTEVWTKQAAIKRLQHNVLMQEAMRLEPQLQRLVQQAQQQTNEQGYNRIQTWQSIKQVLQGSVGFQAHNPRLRTRQHWEAVARAVNDLFPPDDIDLYPDDKSQAAEAELARLRAKRAE